VYFPTRGIFLKQTPYSETSAVVKIYTEEFGLQSYILKGLRSKRSKFRPAFLQPLGLLDLIVTRKEKANLQHIREVKPGIVFNSIPQDIHKTSVLLFLNELLYKSLQEENPNRELFGFIFDSLLELEKEDLPGSFHLVFAMRLTKYLGFYPSGRYDANHSVFDLEEGTFIPAPSISGFGFLSGQPCKDFDQLIGMCTETNPAPGFSYTSRRELLDNILLYYGYHLPSAKDFKSHKVLHEVLGR
jgi:DNA repair protein RecO (recombination protein O)